MLIIVKDLIMNVENINCIFKDDSAKRYNIMFNSGALLEISQDQYNNIEEVVIEAMEDHCDARSANGH